MGIAHQLMSLPSLWQKGWMMKSEQTQNPINGILKLQYEKQRSFAFDQIIKSGECTLKGVCIVRCISYNNQWYLDEPYNIT